MTDAELISILLGFLALTFSVIGVFLYQRRDRKELELAKATLRKDMEALGNTKDSIAAEREAIQRDREALKELKKAIGVMTDMLSVQREEIRVLQENMRRQQSTSEDELKLRTRQHDYQVKKDVLLSLISAWDRFKERE